MKNDCSIVILSYNVKDITDRSIKEAKIAADYSQKKLSNHVEIIVVDNGSTDGTVAMVRKKYPDITFIALPENTGVAYGYNEGMRHVKTPFFLLINSDTMLDRSTIFDSITYMNSNADCSVATGRILTPGEKFKTIGGYLPSPFKTIRWYLGIESIPFLRRFLHCIYGEVKDFSKEQILEWVPTCFFFCRKEVFTKTRGHDEKMFLYMEDLEWCKRIHDKGMKIFFTPTISAVHLGGASTKKKSEITYLFLLQKNIDGLRYYHYKHHSKTVWLVDIILKFGLNMRSLYYAISDNNAKASAYKKIVFKSTYL